MTRSLFGLALFCFLGIASFGTASAQGTVGPTNQIFCNQIATSSITAATTLNLISGTTSQNVNICGWHVTSSTSTVSSFLFAYAAPGTSCSATTALTPAFSITNTAPSADHVGYAGFAPPLGSAICVTTAGGVSTTAVLLYYSKF